MHTLVTALNVAVRGHLQCTVQAVGQAAGITKHVTCHVSRHTVRQRFVGQGGHCHRHISESGGNR